MDLADLETTEARENRLGEVVGRAIVGAVLPPVIHPANLVLGRQPVIRIGFVDTNDGTGGDVGRRQLADIGLVLIFSDERECLLGPGATGRYLCLGVRLPDHHNAAPVRVLILRQAPVYSVFLLVRRPSLAAHVRPIDVNFALQGRFLPVHQ